MLRNLRLLTVAVPVVALAAGTASAQRGDATEPSGIFLEEAGAIVKRLSSSTSMDVQTKGIAKMILTQGLSKPKQVVTHSGAKADVVITMSQPSFVFRFGPPPNRSDPMSFMTEEDALPFMSQNPKDFGLVRMTVVDDSRVVDTGKLEKIDFEVQSLKTREFRVRVSRPLMTGEYAFFLAAQSRGGGVPAQIWAFSYLGTAAR